MDEVLRAAHPGALRATPKPRVILQQDSVVNARVSYIPVAWTSPVRVGSAQARDGGEGDASDAGAAAESPSEIFIGSNGRIGRPFATPLARDHVASDLDEFLRLNNQGFAKCRLALEDGTLVIGEGCARSRALAGDRSDRLAYNAAGKWITVTTGLVLSMLDEDRIVAVLAHEVGHYYRAHSVQPTDMVNYFYALGDGNADRKPSPDPRSLEQTAKVRDKLRSEDWFVDFTEENRDRGSQVRGGGEAAATERRGMVEPHSSDEREERAAAGRRRSGRGPG